MSPTARAATLLALLVLLAPQQARSASAAGAAHSLRGAHLGATGGTFGSLGQPGAAAASGATSSVRLGFWAVALPDLLLELELLGTAQGGSVSLSVAGVPLVVPTGEGQTAADVAAAIAAAIEANAALAALRVRGVAVGSAVFTNGGVTMLVIADAGLGQPALIPLAPVWALVLLGALLLGLSSRRRLPVALAVLAAGVFPGGAAAVPLEVSYQGQLLDTGGLPLTGSVTLELRLWNDATSTDPGDLLYEETHAAVSITAGVFSVSLGGGVASVGSFDADLLAAPALWLESEVDGDVLAPRERLLAVPYAIRAGESESVGSLESLFVEHYFEQGNFDESGPNNTDPLEGVADPDGDGVLNFLDPDNDDDGLSDTVEVGLGTDLNLVTPRITALVPDEGVASATTMVQVQGTAFQAGLSVSFGTETPTAMNLTSTSFDVQVGPQALGAVSVTVINPNGENDAATFAFTNPGLVFTTAQTYDGNLGGLLGADAKCQAAAGAAGLPGTYMAWLSDGVTDPASRFNMSFTPYENVNSTNLAADWTALVTNNFLGTSVGTTETGSQATTPYTWSNVAQDGTTWTASHCLAWTSGSSSAQGAWGRTATNSQTWTEGGSGGNISLCDQQHHLFCFEQ